ncbi:MAG: insulinase family protein [candidate division Zixibacteria bacterium]|nr:insulinase family protein [candidate division Zixibacteria bacterium]
MLATLDKGTARRNALDISESMARNGTALYGSTFQESVSLGFDTLTRHLPAALDLFADVVRNPLFPDDEFERERNRHSDNLSQGESNPQALTARLAPRLIFGTEHPYGLPVHGFFSTISGIGRPDIVHVYDHCWGPSQSAIVFAGDVTLNRAMELAHLYFGDWTGESLAEVALPFAVPAASGCVYLINRPNAPQTVVAQALPAPPRKTNDYYALRLVDSIYGGDFQSRLNRNLREEKGFTYGISSMLALMDKAGYWKAQTAIQTDRTGDTLYELRAELEALTGERPITESELEEARINRVRGYAQQFETIRRLAGIVGGLWSGGLPMSDIRDAVDRIERTTLEEVHAAAARYARPEQAIYLLVGDRDRILPQIEARGFGPVVMLDQEGRGKEV